MERKNITKNKVVIKNCNINKLYKKNKIKVKY